MVPPCCFATPKAAASPRPRPGNFVEKNLSKTRDKVRHPFPHRCRRPRRTPYQRPAKESAIARNCWRRYRTEPEARSLPSNGSGTPEQPLGERVKVDRARSDWRASGVREHLLAQFGGAVGTLLDIPCVSVDLQRWVRPRDQGGVA